MRGGSFDAVCIAAFANVAAYGGERDCELHAHDLYGRLHCVGWTIVRHAQVHLRRHAEQSGSIRVGPLQPFARALQPFDEEPSVLLVRQSAAADLDARGQQDALLCFG